MQSSTTTLIDDFSNGIQAWTFTNGRPGERGNYWTGGSGQARYVFFFEPSEGSLSGGT